jgi:hypothetical protein
MEIAARSTAANSSSPRQPGTSVREKAPTSNGASIAAAPATTFASEMAAALHSPCRSERVGWALIRRRLPQKPVTRVAERLVAALGAAAKAPAPAAIPTAPPQSVVRLPRRRAGRSPSNPVNRTPRAKAPKCSPAAP